jgi:hypothetical protein
MFHKFVVLLCAFSLGACHQEPEDNAGTRRPAQAYSAVGQLFAGKMMISPSSGHDPWREFFYPDGRWTTVFQAVDHVEMRGRWHTRTTSDGEHEVCVCVELDSRGRMPSGKEICRSVKVTTGQVVKIEPIIGPSRANNNRMLVDIPS